MATPDTRWFDDRRDDYLQSSACKEFEAIAGANLGDLASDDLDQRRHEQARLAQSSVILNEIHKSHFRLFDTVPNPNPQLDKRVRRDAVDAIQYQFGMPNHSPISLPDRKVLDRNIGYNWLAVAIKER